MYVPIKTTPRCAETLPRRLTTNDTQIIEVAMNKHITPVTGRNSLTPNIVFTWRFAECQENKATYHHVIAHTEDEARSQLPGLLLVFTARIRQGVNYV
ncbi:host cell division inhibitor Icd-like protein [Morganella morganii]|nr:host cell division inhibitor Icd-like protein [Morganella morganii]